MYRSAVGHRRIFGRLEVAILFAACATTCSSPSRPSTSLAAPVMLQPPVLIAPPWRAVIVNLDQPIALVVQNAPTPNGIGDVKDTFEVASDSTFSSVVASETVAAHGTAFTTLTLPHLPPDRGYSWRVRVSADGATTATSQISAFIIGPADASRAARLTIDGMRIDRSAAPCSLSKFHNLFQFDGGLLMNGSALTFTAPPAEGPALTLRLGIDTGSHVSGTIGGASYTSTPVPNLIEDGFSRIAEVSIFDPISSVIFGSSVNTTGMINADASVTGSFFGGLFMGEPSIDGDACVATYTWSVVRR